MTTKDSNSTRTTDGTSSNAFEAGRPGTAARDRAEGRIEGVRDLGGVFVDAVRATRLPMVLTDPTHSGDPIVFANQAFLDLSGYTMDEVLGQEPHFMNGPDTDADDAERFAQILSRDEDGTVETVQYAKDGRRFVATVLLSAFKGDTGETIHHSLTWADVTGGVAAEEDAVGRRTSHAALRESEARNRLLLASLTQAVWETDAGGVVVTDSPSWRAYTGQTVDEWLGYGWLDAVHPDDRAYAERQWKEAVAARALVNAEFRLRSPDGGWRWTNIRAAPVLYDDGTVEKWAGINIDIEANRQGDAALRESEEHLRLIVENARDYAIFTMDLDGIVTDWREGAEAVFGYQRGEIIGTDGDKLFTPEDITAGEPDKERAMAAATGRAPDVRWHMCKNGRRVFIEGVNTALFDAEGKLTGFLKIGRDATDRHEAEGRQELLLAELQHRVRNILAMVRSVVRQSSEGHVDLDDFVAHLVGRLDAIARTQVLLTRAAGAKVDLETLVRDELLTQLADEMRVWVEGPAVHLSPKAAEVLTLALHELATNSLKYGALCDPDGRLSVTWTIADRERAQWLHLTWNEQCRQDRAQPATPGFGTELIEERVPYELKGDASLEVTDEGVRAEIAFPLTDGESILETRPTSGV